MILASAVMILASSASAASTTASCKGETGLQTSRVGKVFGKKNIPEINSQDLEL